MKKIAVILAIFSLVGCVSSGLQRVGIYSVEDKTNYMLKKYPKTAFSAFSNMPNGEKLRRDLISNLVYSVDNIQNIYQGAIRRERLAKGSNTHNIYLPLVIITAKRFAAIERLSPEFEKDLFTPIEYTDMYSSNIKKITESDLDSCLIWVNEKGGGCSLKSLAVSKGELELLYDDSKMAYDGTNQAFWQQLSDTQEAIKSSGTSLGVFRVASSTGRGDKFIRNNMSQEGKSLYDHWENSVDRAMAVKKEVSSFRKENKSTFPFLRANTLWNPKTKQAFQLSKEQLIAIQSSISKENANGHFQLENDQLYIVHGGNKTFILSLNENSTLSAAEINALGGWETR